jgi:sulfate permease
MSITIIAIAISLFFAVNIGASGAAASMGVAYGSGAIKNKRIALVIVAIGVFLGAYLGGGEVVKTLGSGIVPSNMMTVQLVVIILVSSTFTLFGANMLGIPLSTSEVTVGSVIGVGVAFQVLHVEKVLVILFFWVAIPLLSFFIAYAAGYFIRYLEKRDGRWKGIGSGRWTKILMTLVICAGFIEAFSAGMNNVANAVGSMVGAGMMTAEKGVFWGGLFVSIGAILLGGRVLETNGKKITNMSLLQGIVISSTGGVLVVLSSLLGIPVPLTQVTTTAILGIGTADHGFRLWQKGVITKTLRVWLVSPLLSMVVSFTLVKIFIQPSPYMLVILASLVIAIIGLASLYNTIQYEKRIVNEDGGGI